MMNVAIQIEHGIQTVFVGEACLTGIAMMFDSATKRYRNDRGVDRDGQHLPLLYPARGGLADYVRAGINNDSAIPPWTLTEIKIHLDIQRDFNGSAVSRARS